MGLRTVARALSHRNYRLFLTGQGISLIGTWMQQVGVSWLVLRLAEHAHTDSEKWLGYVAFCGQIPAFFTAPLAGVMADRWDRHRALVISQSLAMLQAAVLVALTASRAISINQILVLSMFLGFVNAFDIPLRQSFLVEMVPKKEDLANAIALNSSLVNMSRVGQGLAGLLIELGGTVMCFVLNALSYVAVLVALLLMRDLPRRVPRVHPPVWHGLKEGLRYVYHNPPIRSLLILMALTSLMAMPMGVLMPVFATKVLHGQSALYGFLMAASGVGALTSAIYLAARRHILGLARQLTVATGVLGLGMTVFSFSTLIWLSMSVLLVTGFCLMFQMAVTNTLVQILVDEDKRGRVMSLYTTALFGSAPLGSLMGGEIAARYGAPLAVRIGGIGCVISALLFAMNLPRLRGQLREVYRRTGILPPLATALQVSSDLMTPPEDAGV